MIVLMAAGLRLFVSRELEDAARAHAEAADPGHQHHSAASEDVSWRARLTSAQAWSDVAHNFRGDWQMLWREVGVGFLLAGFVGQLPDHVLMAVTMIVAALIVAGLFDLLGLIASGVRPSRADIFGAGPAAR